MRSVFDKRLAARNIQHIGRLIQGRVRLFLLVSMCTSGIAKRDATLNKPFLFLEVTMSVKIMSLVWESGQYEGGTLLVLLALADWADDEGECWPGVTKLSAKARLKRRQTQNVLRRLEGDGVLVTALNVGRGNQNHYFLNVQKLRLLEKVQSTTEKAQSVTENVQPSAPDPLVPDPSVNTHTTAGADSASPQDPGEGNEPVTEQTSFPAVHPDGSGDPPPGAFVAVGNVLARIGQPPGFSASASAKIAAGARQPKRRPAKPEMLAVPDGVADKISPEDYRTLGAGLSFDRGEQRLRVEAWQVSRQKRGATFASRAAMMADLRAYLINCTVGKNQRRAS